MHRPYGDTTVRVQRRGRLLGHPGFPFGVSVFQMIFGPNPVTSCVSQTGGCSGGERGWGALEATRTLADAVLSSASEITAKLP